jgi:hypothetical protein
MSKRYFVRVPFLVAATILLFVNPTFAQKRDAVRIEYRVSIASIPGQIFHVTTEVKNINEPRL